MARPGLMRHRKFARLERLLGSKALAMGHLEILWEVAYECGDDLLGDAGDVETLGAWQGEPGRLSSALLESGFLDSTPEGLRVHDLWDHAPEYVKKRRKREAERRQTGAELRAVDAERRTTADDGHRTAPNGTPPAPAPAPAPTQEARAEKPRSLDVLLEAWRDQHPASARLLDDLDAKGVRLRRPAKPNVSESVELSAKALGPEAALVAVLEAHAEEPHDALGWYSSALYRAAHGKSKPKRSPVDAWTPNPGLDVAPDEAERRWLSSPERQAAIARGEIQA